MYVYKYVYTHIYTESEGCIYIHTYIHTHSRRVMVPTASGFGLHSRRVIVPAVSGLGVDLAQFMVCTGCTTSSKLVK